jgi:hypothetical protein
MIALFDRGVERIHVRVQNEALARLDHLEELGDARTPPECVRYPRRRIRSVFIPTTRLGFA